MKPGRQRSFASLRMTGLVLLLAAACQREDAIPTFNVQPTQFSRRVTAEGVLKSTKATPLSAPMQVPMSLKIAWVADDGALVKKDDVVVRFDPTDFQKDLLGGRDDRHTVDNKITKTTTLASTTPRSSRATSASSRKSTRRSPATRSSTRRAFSACATPSPTRTAIF